MPNATDFGNTSGQYGYNIANQPVLVTLPATGQGAGNATVVTTYSYPGGPRIASTVYDENGNQVRHVTTGYGHEDELVSMGGDTDTVTYAYDGMYRVTSLTDGNAHATDYYYNHTGFLYGVTYPGYTGTAATFSSTSGDWSGLSGKDSVAYAGWDNLGNPATRTDGNGAATTYAYVDPESRLSKITYPTSTLPNTTIQYDGYGRLLKLNNGTTITNAGYTSGSTTYPGYDDDDNALNVQTAFLAADHSTTLFSSALSYAYNPDGSRAQMGTPAGTFSYAYDNDDRLSTLTNPFSEQSAWQYDTDSRLQSQTLSNGIVSSYAYNARSFLTDLLNKGGSTTLSEFGGSTPSTAMTYDALGDVTSVKASIPAAPSSYSGTTNYQYDAKTELTQEASTRSGGYTNADSYDLAENPTQVRGVAQPTANADNQLPVSGVTFDGNGNPSKVEGLTAAFDILNRATALGSVSNTWGGNGLRAGKTTTAGTTYFLYDGSIPVCELSSTGAVTATSTFGGAGLISRHTSGGSTFYTFDAQGNVAQRYTSTGSLVSSDLYDAFGKGTSTGGGDVFGYEGQAGYYTDTSTGLILCGHRFYDASAGRFINRDPIGYAGGINLYGYTGNNASNGVDPSGFCGGDEDTPTKSDNSGGNNGSNDPFSLGDHDPSDTGDMIGVDIQALVDAMNPPPVPEVEPPVAPDPPGTTTFTGPSGSTISPDRLNHILDGEQTSSGYSGGHGLGRNTPGQSEFPFSDADVEKYVDDIVNDPNTQWQLQDRPYDDPNQPRYIAVETRGATEGGSKGVNITVVFEPNGEGTITAYPDTEPNRY